MKPGLGPSLIGQIRLQLHQLPLELRDDHAPAITLGLENSPRTVRRDKGCSALLVGALKGLWLWGYREVGGGTERHRVSTALHRIADFWPFCRGPNCDEGPKP
jgi:hypothetical protein